MKRGRVRSYQCSDRGFTVIELLIVIAVLVVLTAILLPCLRAARAATKRAVCSSQLRQIGTAWFVYLNDSQGRFYQDDTAHVKFGGWPGLMGYMPRPLNPYLGLEPEPNETEARILNCPADRGGVPDPGLQYERVYRLNGNSYCANVFLVGRNRVDDFTDDADYWDAVRNRMVITTVDEVGNPSRVLLAGDFGWYGQWNPLRDKPLKLAEWHGRANSFNIVFVDGHVAFLEIEKGALASNDCIVMPFKELWSWSSRP